MNNKIKKILRKKGKSKIVSLTAYSKSVARLLDKYCDIVLVGDSMANVLYGHKNTHKISLQNIIQHALSVKRGIKKSFKTEGEVNMHFRCQYGPQNPPKIPPKLMPNRREMGIKIDDNFECFWNGF